MLTVTPIDTQGISKWYGIDHETVAMMNDLVVTYRPENIIDIVDEVTRKLKRYAYPMELICLGYICGLHRSIESSNELLFEACSPYKRLN